MRTTYYGLLDKLKLQVKRGIVHAVNAPQVRRAILNQVEPRREESLRAISNLPGPYAAGEQRIRTRFRQDIVFVTGRFRSGSTALWNAFRQLEEVTAYYEPFNERRFFDKDARGDGVDPTHRGVTNYALEYDTTSGLAELYEQDWTRRSLYMDADAWNPKMLRFIERLVECAPGRPVLQFNRVDFRLPWLRAQFPAAKIVHLWRNPREQWCSVIGDLSRFPYDAPPANFPDRFYQSTWENDLRHTMPFLRIEENAHPYRLFYLLWKTSWLFGRQYASTSIAYESLVADPARTLGELADTINLEASAATRMHSAISESHTVRWADYADASWFESHERACEVLLDEFFGAAKDATGRNAMTENQQ
ncbi:sulfotransferase [Granulosicoccus sp.]|nr:sulfotransferase [Granulosicoccus sp.]